MFYIAHRGNTDGPLEFYENKPDYINSALAKKYDVEVDLWRHNKKWYLGHDEPQYVIDQDFLFNKKIWCHIKNLEALDYVANKLVNVHYFWHDTDSYTLTSKGYVWVYPGEKLIDRCIAVKPEINNLLPPDNIGGICSDYIANYRHGTKFELQSRLQEIEVNGNI